jgi:hypothetical protein
MRHFLYQQSFESKSYSNAPLQQAMAHIQVPSATHLNQAMPASKPFHYAPQPNCRFNADANTGHGFAIFMASVGALRASRSGAG